MAKKPKSPKEIQDEMARLQSQLKAAEASEEAAFGKMARKAGVFDHDVGDDEMKEALNDLVKRFRDRSSNTGKPETSQTHSTADTANRASSSS